MGLFKRSKTVDIFFVGCDGNDLDRGIYAFYLDVTNGDIIKKTYVKSLANPISMSPNGRFVNITYRNGTGRASDGGVWQYAAMELQLGLTARMSNEGRTYIQTVTNKERTYCYAIDYYNGEIVIINIKHSKVIAAVETYKLTGSSVDPIKQTESHPSQILFAPDDKLIVLDMGGDEVLVYDVIEKGRLVKDEAHSFKVAPGSGPRKLLFDSEGEHAYLINEISSTIEVYEYDEGQFTKLYETLSYLPEEFSGDNTPIDFTLTSDDQLLIVLNKGDDTIVVFEIDQETHALRRIDCIETAPGPRCLALFRDRWLVVASRQGNNVESFEIRSGERKGVIFETHSVFALHAPVFIYKGKENLRVVT